MCHRQHDSMCQWDSGPGGSVLVLGDYRQTVTVVRSLARAGYEVTLGTDDPRSSTAFSRYLHDRAGAGAVLDHHRLAEALGELGADIARVHVGRTADAVGHDQLHRPGWIA